MTKIFTEDLIRSEDGGLGHTNTRVLGKTDDIGTPNPYFLAYSLVIKSNPCLQAFKTDPLTDFRSRRKAETHKNFI